MDLQCCLLSVLLQLKVLPSLSIPGTSVEFIVVVPRQDYFNLPITRMNITCNIMMSCAISMVHNDFLFGALYIMFFELRF